MSTIQDVIDEAKKHNKKSDDKLIMKAYEYANNAHNGQLRKSGEPYIIHPIEVAYIVASIQLDDYAICAALLHDVVEDTSVTLEDIENEFGKDIATSLALYPSKKNTTKPAINQKFLFIISLTLPCFWLTITHILKIGRVIRLCDTEVQS